jgi:hypothetical protein
MGRVRHGSRTAWVAHGVGLAVKGCHALSVFNNKE